MYIQYARTFLFHVVFTEHEIIAEIWNLLENNKNIPINISLLSLASALISFGISSNFISDLCIEKYIKYFYNLLDIHIFNNLEEAQVVMP